MSQDKLQELIDYREICELKHSFGRLADVTELYGRWARRG